ncbi:MAC/Perforin domain-containing protein isoform X2 [Tasmannia lanceolata]|uniref:MAC/Perforin domain-containing protein isoform X2 n=1 Tax=Tasmannia lanceolata TaxID=3420 RepID=UPI004063343E
MAFYAGRSSPQSSAEKAVSVIGFGYDLSSDLRLSYCKSESSRLIELDETRTRELVFPGGIVVPNVSKAIKCDKGERTWFRSDVLSFHQMSEQFNQGHSLSGKIPCGLFNSMFNFRGCWQKDASATKALAFDGCFITLYNIELARSQIVLHEHIKREVPSSWDPAALAGFIEKYGTHIIVGVKMGAKDVIYIKQQQNSILQPTEVQKLLKKLADERFSEHINGSFIVDSDESTKKPQDVIIIHVRRGGMDNGRSHSQWLSTISHAPDVISMSFMPITSLLNGVSGSGFLIHAVNLYLRYKPRIEELEQFLEFQLPRQWAPVFGELALGPQRKRQGSTPSLQFSFMGPKLYVNMAKVDSGNRPVTGIRLYLEGKKSDRLAIHLQHLSTLPRTLQLSDDYSCESNDDSLHNRGYYEPVKRSLFSHACTAPVQYCGSRIDDTASIVTKAWFEVKDVGMKKVLFLRLGFSMVSSAKIRRSEWDGPTSFSRKSGSISAMFSTRFSTGLNPDVKPPGKVELNSAVFPGGPPAPAKLPTMSRFVDTKEMVRGPEDLPGYWVMTGAKLCVEGAKISLKVKYSLLTIISEVDGDEGGIGD